MILSPVMDEQGRMRHYVLNHDSWDQFEEVVQYITSSLQGVILERIDGPDARVWTMEFPQCTVTFTHNDMLGNSFYSSGENAAPVLQKIIYALEQAKL